jgi:hypothetical protein
VKKQSLSDFHDVFVNAAMLRGKSIMKGDAKTANRQYAVLKRIYLKAEKDIDAAKIFYNNLRNNPETIVKLAACAHSLTLGIDIVESEVLLSLLAKDQNIGISRLDAEMTLKVWKKQGYLKF